MSPVLHKSHWKRVAFGDVVRNVNETVRDIEAASIGRVIAMEHMDPGELKVSRWGSTEDGTTFTRRVKPGQTLFGKRRAYQRKVAYAEFDAVCSGDIYTFESDEAQLLGELLPFLVQSNGFFAHAVGTSAGSLSPRTNWRDLKDFEFDLPPLDEQKRIADLLWATEAELLARRAVLDAVDTVIAEFCLSTYRSLARTTPMVPITEISELRMGRQKSPKYASGKYSTPYMRVANIGSLEFNLAEVEEMDFDESDRAKYTLEPGDILLTEGDIVSPMNVGRPALVSEGVAGACFQNTLIRVRPRARTTPEYLLALCEGMRLAGAFAAAASTTTVTHLGLGRLSAMTVPDADEVTQAKAAEGLKALMRVRQSGRASVRSTRELRNSILNEALGGN
ncbi:restriction endonuclease subunit S [Brachybacterium paraconglomeratum]|uniref:restriction endonuclease subunit S n=1 Tax=Brachybacterium paraconglomeratum TaxID=173362 RepID=UPI003FD0633A